MHVHFIAAVHFDMETFLFFWIPRNLLPFYEKNIMATWSKPISLQDTLVLIFYDLWYVRTMLFFPFGSKSVHIFLIITGVAIVFLREMSQTRTLENVRLFAFRFWSFDVSNKLSKSGFSEQQLFYTRNWHKTDFPTF